MEPAEELQLVGTIQRAWIVLDHENRDGFERVQSVGIDEDEKLADESSNIVARSGVSDICVGRYCDAAQGWKHRNDGECVVH